MLHAFRGQISPEPPEPPEPQLALQLPLPPLGAQVAHCGYLLAHSSLDEAEPTLVGAQKLPVQQLHVQSPLSSASRMLRKFPLEVRSISCP